MGMYSTQRFDLKLKPDTPAPLIMALQGLADIYTDASAVLAVLQDHAETQAPHPFFLLQYWYKVLWGAGGGFEPDWAVPDVEPELTKQDDGTWHLTATSATKDGRSLPAEFLDWLTPYLVPQDEPVAKYAYEETYWDWETHWHFSADGLKQTQVDLRHDDWAHKAVVD